MRNQNKFRTSKNTVLIQKCNGSCLIGVIRWQKVDEGCLFREKSVFLATNQDKFGHEKIEFWFKKEMHFTFLVWLRAQKLLRSSFPRKIRFFHWQIKIISDVNKSSFGSKRQHMLVAFLVWLRGKNKMQVDFSDKNHISPARNQKKSDVNKSSFSSKK